MSTDNFEFAFNYLLSNEGGFSSDPDDAGGPTRWGITQETASRWVGRHLSTEEMKSLTLDQAKAIYRAWFWLLLKCDEIPDRSIATAIFDIGVNCGMNTASKLAQKACQDSGYLIKADGHIGDNTIKALIRVDSKVFIHNFAARVRKHYETLIANNPKLKKFEVGWLARADRLLTLAEA